MAVTLTTLQLAARMRIGDGTTALEEPLASVLDGIRASATATVEKYAPAAPESVQNEAVTRLGAYLYDAPPGRGVVNPLASSGAQALLAPYRVQRARSLNATA